MTETTEPAGPLLARELPPETHRIELTHTQSRFVATYMPVFARSTSKGDWGFNVSHPAENGKYVELKKFWECPALADFLRDGKIFEGPTLPEGADIYMRMPDFVDYLEVLVENVQPADKEKEHFNMFGAFVKRMRRSPKNMDLFVRLRNSYSIQDVSQMYDPTLFADPNYYYYAVTAEHPKGVRVTSEETLQSSAICDAIARTRILDGDSDTIARVLVTEAMHEGFPFDQDNLAEIAGVWGEFQGSLNRMTIVIAGDVGKRDETSEAASPIYQLFAGDINKRITNGGESFGAYIYFTDAASIASDGRLFQRIMKKMFIPHNFDIKVVHPIVGTNGVQYQMIIIVPKAQ
jgi:hypothetical protein